MGIELKDKIMLEIAYLKSMMMLLAEHFEQKRYKDLATDYIAISRNFEAYRDLLYLAEQKIRELEDLLKNATN